MNKKEKKNLEDVLSNYLSKNENFNLKKDENINKKKYNKKIEENYKQKRINSAKFDKLIREKEEENKLYLNKNSNENEILKVAENMSKKYKTGLTAFINLKEIKKMKEIFKEIKKKPEEIKKERKEEQKEIVQKNDNFVNMFEIPQEEVIVTKKRKIPKVNKY